MTILAAVVLIELHGTGGQTIALNPKTVVSLRLPRRGDHFPPGTMCWITTLDGKFVAVTDTCAAVRELLPK